MLEVDRISVFYGDIQVVFDLSLRVGAGEIVTLIGSNGAGKTSTVNAISGVLPPRSGDIRYQGRSIVRLAPHQLVAQGLVQVPEGRMLFPDMTVLEHLKMGAYTRDSRREFARRLGWVCELFPVLSERRTQAVKTMSGGEQQMVAIARGLMSAPRLLLLDEPSIGLAPLLVSEMFRVIEEINRQQVSVLLIEQNAVQALQLCHRAYVLEHGRLAHEGEGASLLADDRIRSAYLGVEGVA